jgi:drug/metabolite transporter (DMT)-like permease
MQAMVSMSLALNPSAFCTKPGRCLAEQVGLGQLNVVRIGCDFVNDNGLSTATAIIALLPAVASLIAIPVRGERPAPIACVAIAIIIGGVLLAACRPNEPEATGPERRVT